MQMRVWNVQMFNENASTIISNIASNILICRFHIPYAIRHRVQPQSRVHHKLPLPQLLLPLPLAQLVQNCIFCSICFWNFIWLPRFMLGGKTMAASWPAVTSAVNHTTPFNLATDYMYMCVAVYAASPPPPPLLTVCNSICCIASDCLHWPGRWQTQNADFNCDHSHCCCSFYFNIPLKIVNKEYTNSGWKRRGRPY